MSRNRQSDLTSASKVVFEPEPAAELVDLLTDEPGEADEELLDQALASLDEGKRHLPGPVQEAVGSGELVAIQVEPEEVDVARQLIERNHAPSAGAAKRLGQRLKGRIQRARHRAKQRRTNEKDST